MKLLLLGALACLASAWKQTRIVTSFWVDPIVPAGDFPAVYKDIASANFTTVMGGFGATTPALLTAQTAATAAAGLDLIADTAGLAVGDLPLDVWGYFLKDEPSASEFPALANLSSSIHARSDAQLTFINLLPNYALPSQLGAATYAAYLKEFVEVVKPPMLCIDHYPLMQADGDTRTAYTANLASLRSASLAAGGIPYWNYFAAMPYGTHQDVTPAMLHWQAFSSLAFGGKGVLYFCLWTPAGSDFVRGGALYTPQGNGTYVHGPHFATARTINSVIAAWSPHLMAATSPLDGTRTVLPNATNPATALKGSALVNVTAGVHLLVGDLNADDGSTLVMVVNWDLTFVAWPTLEFANTTAAGLSEVDQGSGVARPVVDESPLLAGLQLRFSPGHARLFRVQ